MSYKSRIERALRDAPVLPLNNNTRYILMSDCHRGTGSANDNFLPNQAIFLGALQFYFFHRFHYIELGDGEELWENCSLDEIEGFYKECYEWFTRYKACGQFHRIYGNHDMERRDDYPEAIWLEGKGVRIGLLHGHQADFLNSVLWKASRYLVLHVWKRLERIGVKDPTQASKNYKKGNRVERRLASYAKENNLLIIAGHTHRGALAMNNLGVNPVGYANTGSCVHPYGIVGIEICGYDIRLVRWREGVKKGQEIYAKREVVGNYRE